MINIAPLGSATQSSFSKYSHCDNEAVNSLTGFMKNGYSFHTSFEDEAWWAVDLKKLYPIDAINIHPRLYFESRYDPDDIHIQISKDMRNWEDTGSPYRNHISEPYKKILYNKIARFIRISISNNVLHLGPIEIFTDEKLMVFRGCILMKDTKLISEQVMNFLENGEYENREINLSMQNIDANDIILELGASIGAVSTIINSKFKIQNYFAVEANPDLIPLIKKNHGLNNIHCEIIQGAISADKKETVDFYVNKSCWGSSLRPLNNYLKVIKVNSININELLNSTKANFIICDIEGAEFDIFNNINLSAVNKICIEIHPKDSSDISNLYSYLRQQGFMENLPPPKNIINHVRFFKKQNL